MNISSFTKKSTLMLSLLAIIPACDPGQQAKAPQQEQSIEEKKEAFARLKAADQAMTLQDRNEDLRMVASFTGNIVEIDFNYSGWYLLLVDPLARRGMNVWVSPANLPEDSGFDPSWMKLGNKLHVEGRLQSSWEGDDVLVARSLRLESQDDAGKEKPLAITRAFNFDHSREGWKALFTDYPPGEDTTFELDFALAGLPGNLDSRDKALSITGNNRSDDLFMAVYKRIDGLTPGQAYDVRINAQIASNAFKGAVGVGGSPGSSVYVKLGAINHAPGRYYSRRRQIWMANFDKANQSNSGKDMVVVGDMEISTEDENTWEILHRSNANRPVRVKANDRGQLWILAGTDSGFEATTTAYYTSIEASFTPVR